MADTPSHSQVYKKLIQLVKNSKLLLQLFTRVSLAVWAMAQRISGENPCPLMCVDVKIGDRRIVPTTTAFYWLYQYNLSVRWFLVILMF